MRTYLLACTLLGTLCACDITETPEFGDSVAGQGSTLARFVIAGDELYILDKTQVRHFDISDPTTPVEGERITVDFTVQSLYSYRNYLFMSNVNELNVFDLANPDQPTFVKRYEDINACTPIGFQGDYAYLGRRQGNECGWNEESELAVLNVRDFSAIRTERTYSGTGRIASPFYISTSAPNGLFLCEGTQGLRIFDTTDPVNLVQTGYTPSFKAFSIVPNGNIAIIKGGDGLYQYDVSNPTRIREVSRIPYQN